jgi:hypothetical protein
MYGVKPLHWIRVQNLGSRDILSDDPFKRGTTPVYPALQAKAYPT